MTKTVKSAVKDAKRALAGDSNDAEHDALAGLLEALEVRDMPECTCGELDHDTDCPVVGWVSEAL